MPKPKTPNRYTQILECIFTAHFKPGSDGFVFKRDEIKTTATKLGIVLPDNIGDLVYNFRYRYPLPASIVATAPHGRMWVIQPAGRSVYRFAHVADWLPEPNPKFEAIKVPDATPGMIDKYRLTDEQGLLARVRYNRLVDLFTGLTCYSLQNHLRTTVKELGQVETDEIYLGLDRRGAHYVLPVQAKGGKDRLSVVQIGQDFALAAEHFPGLLCRPLGAQFMGGGAIALFEFTEGDDGIAIRQEAHYRLVPPKELTPEDLARYRLSTQT